MRQGNFYPQQQVPSKNYGYRQAQQNNNQFSQQIQQSGNRNSPQGYRQNTPPSGDNFDQRLANIDAMIKERMVTCNVPGYSIGIIKSGQVVFEKCYGWADIERRIPVTNDTIFGLASVTKTFTGVTLLSLVDKGLVGLDDPLEKYVDGLTKPYKNLTVRQLSSMAAGVAEKVEP